MLRYRSVEQRFWENVIPEPNSGCWLWIGSLAKRGYGRISLGGRAGKRVGAHRISLKLSGTVVPDEVMVLHHCDMPCCVNPEHLFLGTQYDNIQDMIRKGRHKDGRVTTGDKLRNKPFIGRRFNSEKTHCKHGHPLDDCYIHRGWRVCKTCAKAKSALQKARNRAGSMSLRRGE